jgi:YVTN family beta-propeller protein
VDGIYFWQQSSGGVTAPAEDAAPSAPESSKSSRLARVQNIHSVSGDGQDCLANPFPGGVNFATNRLRGVCAVAALLPLLAAVGCSRNHFPDVPAGYREFAYVSNGAANTVSVLDLVYLRQDRTLQVGSQPTGMAVNPSRDEVYVVNTLGGSVSVIDTDANRVVATIAVHKLPYSISVDADGRRAYVANSGSNSVSVLDLESRREIAVAGTGEQPGLARISPDMRTLVVTNRGSGSVSVFGVEVLKSGSVTNPNDAAVAPRLRAAYSGCAGATDAVILPDSSKAFIACSGGHQVMALSLAAAPDTWAAKQNASLLTDHMLALLDVGVTPLHLALKPDGGQIFCSNFGSDSITAIDTQTNEVSRTDTIANRPVYSVVSADNSTLWISNFGADSINLWSIDDGKMAGSVHTGHAPDALAFSADEHLLLAADSHSGDVSVIRTVDKDGPALFTILPAGGSPNAIVVKAMQGKP